ncbi:MAG: alpha/beta hydrolase [Limnothrix sp. BL-A-16]
MPTFLPDRPCLDRPKRAARLDSIHHARLPDRALARWMTGSIASLAIAWGAGTGPAIAAETITLRYGPLGGALPVTDLVTWADRGELSDDLETYLILSQQRPDRVRQILTQRVTMPAGLLDRALASSQGAILLEQLSQVLQGPKRTDNHQNLRRALMAAAENDGQVSLLELLQKYPTQNVDLRVDRLVNLAETWQQWRDRGGQWLEQLNQWGDRLRSRLLF